MEKQEIIIFDEAKGDKIEDILEKLKGGFTTEYVKS